MTISGDYPTPVYVNGYPCNNCAQVAEAKKDINPADPKAGPGGVDANTQANQASPAVIFGGVLANNNPSSTASSASSLSSSPSPSDQSRFFSNVGQNAPSSTTPGLGGLLNISV